MTKEELEKDAKGLRDKISDLYSEHSRVEQLYFNAQDKIEDLTDVIIKLNKQIP